MKKKLKDYFFINASIMLVLILSFSCTSPDKKRDIDKWTHFITSQPLESQLLDDKTSQGGANVEGEPSKDMALKETASEQEKLQRISIPRFEKTKFSEEIASLQPIINFKALTKQKSHVLINVESMPLYDFIVFALGDTLKVPFFLDEGVKNLQSFVTMRTTEKIDPEKAFEITVQILRQKGLVVGQKSKSLYILLAKNPLLPDSVSIGRSVKYSPEKIVQIVPLKYIQAAELIGLINSIYQFKSEEIEVKVKTKEREKKKDKKKIKKKSKAKAKTKEDEDTDELEEPVGPRFSMSDYQDKNAIILNGAALQVQEIIAFVKMMDVPYIENKKIYMMNLTYWEPAEFITQMVAILDSLGIVVANSTNAPGVLMLPIEHLNNVLIIAPDASVLDFVLGWLRRLDTPESAGPEERTYTYTPQFALASELVESIEMIYGLSSDVTLSGKKKKQKTDPTLVQKRYKKENKKSTKKNANSAKNKKKKSSQGISSDEDELKIAADDRRNAVLILATPIKYKEILHLLKEIDTPPKQILIEVLIAEISWGNTLSYGFAWYLNNEMFNNPFSLSSTSDASLDPFGKLGVEGLLYHMTTNSQKVAIVLKALASDNRLEILSKPSIMVINNESATIQVGDEVPTVSSEVSRTDITNSVDRNIQYRSTGITLRITPIVNAQGLVTLQVFQEVSDAQKTSTSSIDSPTIIKRKIDTSIVAGNGQTVVLGGLMEKTLSRSDTKVPILGDIPVLGFFFKTEEEAIDRKELIVLITPRILNNVRETTDVTNKMREWFNVLQ